MSVKPVKIHAAKTNLSRLISRACDGEEIVIARGREPVVRLVPVKGKGEGRRFGALRGKAKTSAAFFEALPPEELEAWGT